MAQSDGPGDFWPQPGAVLGPYVFNGLTGEQVGPSGWPTLPASEAANFTQANPVLLPPGTVLYRVWGGPSMEIGDYWSPITFETADGFYGEDAVELSWNAGTNLLTMTLGAFSIIPGEQGIPVWSGPCSQQPADDLAGHPLPTRLFHLPGGGEQYYVDPTLGTVNNSGTSWNQGLERARVPSPILAPIPREYLATPETRPYAELAQLVGELVVLLTRTARQEEARGLSLPHLGTQAAILNERRTQLLAALDEIDNGSREILLTATWSFVGVSRYIDKRPGGRYRQEIRDAVESVTDKALGLGRAAEGGGAP